MLSAMELAKKEGADIVELCIASMSFSHISEVERLFTLRTLPSILSFGPDYLKKPCRRYSEKTRLEILKRAVELDLEFVEIHHQVRHQCPDSPCVFSCDCVCSKELIDELKRPRSKTRIIVSSHVYKGDFTREKLADLIIDMQSTDADIIKLVIDVKSITDVAPLFHMLTHCQVPLIARAMGERGLISQLLGPKYGASMIFGSLGAKFIPGLPPLTRKYSVFVSNPVGHSKGPLLHNPAFRHTGYNGIYVPLLVDDINEFFRVYSCNDFAGFSVGIPHKETAVSCCDEVHPLALSIGAVNTIVRRPMDGKLVGYNTDCEACITAIEDAFRERFVRNGEALHVSPIAGKLFVLVGAGGAGRAIAFGARSRGARVVIFNRNFERAKALATAVSGEALPYESLNDFRAEKGMILANASAVGMEPNTDQTPVSKVALKSYELVFDAVYTPRNTRLLQEAAEVGATVVSGVEMFIRQALGQFKLFTGGLVICITLPNLLAFSLVPAPEEFMRKIVLEQF
ncbi:UNVERIFIED_CONTAM: Bifunctional 3-dehydroquinate dehydratase/shikimate dehydrogenase, chloroplastic [Sesamum angustifolium]|uniref:Bifunctional 3-dehydroquinate dehydratase/shikimate dehydrogenase, chloroplastic n=1 Tax=Sesamum angustifolium TaxID=2727405 RepID=A0AAW2QUC0_9LAMI